MESLYKGTVQHSFDDSLIMMMRVEQTIGQKNEWLVIWDTMPITWRTVIPGCGKSINNFMGLWKHDIFYILFQTNSVWFWNLISSTDRWHIIICSLFMNIIYHIWYTVFFGSNFTQVCCWGPINNKSLLLLKSEKVGIACYVTNPSIQIMHTDRALLCFRGLIRVDLSICLRVNSR